MLKAKDKYYQRLRDEWAKLGLENQGLAQVLWDLAVFVEDAFDKDVVITHIYRTQAQQEKFYGKGSKKKSTHQFWGAADIRDSIYTKDEIAGMTDFLRVYDKWNSLKLMSQSKSRTVLRHNIGLGMHFHIQFMNYKGHLPPRQIRFQEGLTIEASPSATAERD